MKGQYVLLLFMGKGRRISIGKKGIFRFRRGFYAYVGSAMNSVEKRVARHMRRRKKKHWHIDYLLEHAEVADVIMIPSGTRENECRIASRLMEFFEPVEGFGSSDCRCRAHLFRVGDA